MPRARPATIFPYMTQTEIHRDLISLTVNGQRKEFTSGITISDLLSQFGLHPRMVVVEHNRSILKDRTRYPSIALSDGDVIELVHFGGGG